MILFWTIMPWEQVMANTEDVSSLEEISIGGVTLLASNVGNDLRIERLVSPNANDYLNPSWQPGAIVHRRDL